ncbi:MAG: cache domain-containing protein [Gammaproteobacteria bacterium]|nr:cache domain-containing protein [Gammaproteobacteria bacterium]
MSGAFVLVAAVLLLSAMVSLSFTRTLLENKVGRQLEVYAGALGTHVGATFAAYARTVELVAQQPRVGVALTQRDPALALQVERDLAAYFPLSLDVRLLPEGLSAVDDSMTPRLGYADLAMIRASETGEKPPNVAVHGIGSEDQHVSMIHRVLDGDGKTVIGHVMVLFDVSLLQNLLNTIGISSGYAELQQRKKDGSLIQLANLGEQKWRERGSAHQIQIADSDWSIVYWAADSGQVFPASYVVRLGVLFGAALLVLALVVVVVLRVWRRADRDDMTTIVTMVRDFRVGQLGEYPARLQDHAGALAAMRGTLEAEIVESRNPGVRQEMPLAGDGDTMNIEL